MFDTIEENENENCWQKSCFHICVIPFDEPLRKLRDLHEMLFIKAEYRRIIFLFFSDVN